MGPSIRSLVYATTDVHSERGRKWSLLQIMSEDSGEEVSSTVFRSNERKKKSPIFRGSKTHDQR